MTFTYYDQSSCFKTYISLDQNLVIVGDQTIDFFYWNSESQDWSRRNLGEITLEYNKDWNTSQYLVPLPMIAPVIATVRLDQDIPYEDFRFFRLSYSQVGLELKTKRLFMRFVFTAGKVTLESSDQRTLRSLYGVVMSVQELLLELKQRNVFLSFDIEDLIGY